MNSMLIFTVSCLLVLYVITTILVTLVWPSDTPQTVQGYLIPE